MSMTKTVGYDEEHYVVFTDLLRRGRHVGKLRITLWVPVRPPESGKGKKGCKRTLTYEEYMEHRRPSIYADALFYESFHEGWRDSFIREQDVSAEDLESAMDGAVSEAGLVELANRFFEKNGFGMKVRYC